MNDIIVMRHRERQRNASQASGQTIRMTSRRPHTSVSTNVLQKKLFSDPHRRIRSPAARLLPFQTRCEDGAELVLDCNEHTLLTGSSSVRSLFRNYIIDYALQLGAPVLVITSTPDDIYSTRSADNTLIRKIDANSFSAGFHPFPGWDEERAVKCLESFIINENEYANAHRQQIIRSLLRLCITYPRLSSMLVDGQISQLQDILRVLPEETEGTDENLRGLISLMRGDVENTNRVLNGLYIFLSMCNQDGGGRGQEWSLISPGITIVNAQQFSYPGQRTGGWFLQRMATFVKDDMSEKNIPLLVVIDCVDQDTLRAYDPFINYSGNMLLVVADSIHSVNQSMRGKLTRQFVFCQTDGEAARYWSEMTGRRNILEEDHTYTNAETWQPLTIFPITTQTSATHEGYQYRAYYEPDEMMILDDRSGFLFTRGYRNSFHRFFYDG